MPGSYQISSAGTALTALYAAGGPSCNGSMRRIEVRRGGRTVDVARRVRLPAARRRVARRAAQDGRHRLRARPRSARARRGRGGSTGHVRDARSRRSLADVLKSAGGFKAEAAQRRVMVERILPPGQRAPDGRDRVVIDVPGRSALRVDGGAVPRRGRRRGAGVPGVGRGARPHRRDGKRVGLRARRASSRACVCRTRCAMPVACDRTR